MGEASNLVETSLKSSAWKTYMSFLTLDRYIHESLNTRSIQLVKLENPSKSSSYGLSIPKCPVLLEFGMDFYEIVMKYNRNTNKRRFS